VCVFVEFLKPVFSVFVIPIMKFQNTDLCSLEPIYLFSPALGANNTVLRRAEAKDTVCCVLRCHYQNHSETSSEYDVNGISVVMSLYTRI
jgi:hypothetical protein